ncbi:MAG: aldehyde dehydrogenase [Myxococcota bacterium]|nr:aldehyde dehydrogenase [Myxococcota bacterium]
MSALPPLFDLIDGSRSAPSVALGLDVTDSSTGEALQPAMATSPEGVEAALAAAHQAYVSGTWTEQSPEERADALDTVADRLELDVERMAELDARTTGITLHWTRMMAQLTPIIFRKAAALLRQQVLATELPGKYGNVSVRAYPLGPAALICPWNSPATITAHKLASALAAGCPVVIKASEHAPHSIGILVDAVERSNVPNNTVQLVHGAASIGAQVVADPRIKAVSFTGGLGGGRAVARACAEDLKPVQLELGGNNPMLVFPEADLNAAADAVVAGLTTLNGQWCRALGRLLIHQTIEESLLERVETRLAKVRLGSALSAESDMGPLIHENHLATVQELESRLLDGPNRSRIAPTLLPSLAGNFHRPTLICGVPPEQAVEEVFGPVATVHPFRDEAHAIELANQTPYGLAAYIFGDEERALNLAGRIHAGTIKINGLTLLALAPDAPRPAWGLSGLGDEGTLETLRFFTGHRVIGMARQRL